MFKKIEEQLFYDTQNLNQEESIIINADIESLWNIITDWTIFNKHVSQVGENIEYNGIPNAVGTCMKITYNTTKSFSNLRVIYSNKNKSKNIKEYEFIEECIDGKPKYPIQHCIFKMIKINSKFTYLNFKHEFKQPVRFDLIRIIGIEKKNILLGLKNSIEDKNQIIL